MTTGGLDFETINVAIAGAGEATITEAGTLNMRVTSLSSLALLITS